MITTPNVGTLLNIWKRDPIGKGKNGSGYLIFSYKYKVDGQWATSHLEAVRLEKGILNNVQIV